MKTRIILLTLLAVFCLISAVSAGPSGATTELQLIRIAENGTTLDQQTVSYQWMEENLPVLGDGVTHYYHQGPVFTDDSEARWDVNETGSFKDRGAVKGTDVKDLCDLIGGMNPEDDVMIVAADGYHVEYGYTTIYTPSARQGPAAVCWYVGEDVSGVGERQGIGYTGKEGYFLGMRLVFLADASTNAEGLHVFGNNDMRETLPEKSVYFYEGLYPSTSGLTVKWVSEIRVYERGYTGEAGVLAKSMTNQTAVPTEAAASPLGIGILLAGILAAGILRRQP
ncbi:MAG: argininosuccinate synthase [Methanocorpusculum sp.]|nr:argininosuccinate synthase [Methanocorpusculum sp.]MDD3257391.1 argininosuccinate synthase [Methanocorpusculum sp.]